MSARVDDFVQQGFLCSRGRRGPHARDKAYRSFHDGGRVVRGAAAEAWLEGDRAIAELKACRGEAARLRDSLDALNEELGRKALELADALNVSVRMLPCGSA